jgi:hypothetical protein
VIAAVSSESCVRPECSIPYLVLQVGKHFSYAFAREGSDLQPKGGHTEACCT